MPGMEIHMKLRGNYSESQFKYDGDPSSAEIDAYLAKAEAAIAAERAALGNCPIHHIPAKASE